MFGGWRAGQPGVEGGELDIVRLESKVFGGFWEQAQGAAGNVGFTEKVSQDWRGCFG